MPLHISLFVDTFSCWYQPVLEMLYRYLLIKDICLMSMVNRQYRDIYQRNYSPKKTFEKAIFEYLDDPVGLRNTMRHAGVVITGSFALRCICNKNWEISNMNIFVPNTRSLAMQTFLIREEEYELVNTWVSEIYFACHVSHIWSNIDHQQRLTCYAIRCTSLRGRAETASGLTRLQRFSWWLQRRQALKFTYWQTFTAALWLISYHEMLYAVCFRVQQCMRDACRYYRKENWPKVWARLH